MEERVPSGPRGGRSRVAGLGWTVRNVAIVAGVMIVLAGAAMVVVTSRTQSTQVAASVDAMVVDDDPTTTLAPTTTTTTLAEITKFVSPAAPTAVGMRTYTFTDPTRGTEARGERPALADRPLTVTIRYPTVGMPSGDEIADAPSLEPAPLVLFAHGFDVSSSRYASLLHDVAAAGFVVVAPEFPMTSTVFSGEPDEYDLPEQSRDLTFLIGALTGADAPAELREMVLPGDIAVMGHSDGAVTSLLAGYAPRFDDSRIGAVVSMSGAFDSYGGAWFSTNDPPLLAIHGEGDEINPFESSVELVDQDPGWAMLVGVEGASHLGSVTSDSTEPAVATAIGWFLSAKLLGVPGANDRLVAVASDSPLRIAAGHT